MTITKEYTINPDRKLIILSLSNDRFNLIDIWDTGEEDGPYEYDIWNFKTLEDAEAVVEILLRNL